MKLFQLCPNRLLIYRQRYLLDSSCYAKTTTLQTLPQWFLSTIVVIFFLNFPIRTSLFFLCRLLHVAFKLVVRFYSHYYSPSASDFHFPSLSAAFFRLILLFHQVLVLLQIMCAKPDFLEVGRKGQSSSKPSASSYWLNVERPIARVYSCLYSSLTLLCES